MPRVKKVLELVKRRYVQAKNAPGPTTKKASSPNGLRQKPVQPGGTSSGVEITRAVFPIKS